MYNINNLSVEQAKEMKEEIDREGMKVASTGSGYGKINIKEDFAPHFEAFKNTVAVAKTLEAKYIRIFSFYFSEGDSYEEYRDEVIRRVKAMIMQFPRDLSAATKTKKAYTAITQNDVLTSSKPVKESSKQFSTLQTLFNAVLIPSKPMIYLKIT